MSVLHPSRVPEAAAEEHAGVGTITAFITGCGRSGTTILGRLLSKHRDVTYLNDQHGMWGQLWPRFDVAGWVPFDPAVPAPLRLTADHARTDPDAAARLRAMLEERRDGRRVLVEKLAQNNMRMPFLRAIVPECVFINIVRHGVEVARSIARRVELGRWYGPRDRKWECLAAHAREHGYRDLLPLCTDPVHRGLLEWRMSVDTADDDAAGETPDRLLRVRYEDLVVAPLGVCERIERFLGLIPRPVMREFARERIAPQSPPTAQEPVHTEAIAGGALRRLGYWA
jgi:Sulfotransferase family